MFPVKLLPLFIIGCATLPDNQIKEDTEPTNDSSSDPTSDSTSDPASDPASDPRIEQASDPINDPTHDPRNDPRNDPTNDPFGPDDFDSMESYEVRSAILERLMTLQRLDVIEVGDVILDLPDEAICAYGWSPCVGFEDEVDDALRQAGPRLDALAHHAQVAADEDAAPRADTCNDAVVDANLDALADLEIVLIGDLLVQEPERNCPYYLPCEEDIIAAELITCARAETLDRIVVVVTQEL
jgi:hypothetical protein